jgi:NTE family protein
MGLIAMHASSISGHDLADVELFSGLQDAERTALALRSSILALRRGDVLMHQGEAPGALYVVLSGRFAVSLNDRPGVLTELGPQQPVGEIAFFTGANRTATVTALRDSLVLSLTRKEFDELVDAHPGIWRTLTRSLANRLANTTSRSAALPSPRARTICVMRAGAAPMNKDFVELLVRVFTGHSSMVRLDSGTVQDLVGRGVAIDSDDATRTLNELETKANYVLFIADDDLTPWTQKVLRHADVVLQVAPHDAREAVNELELTASRFLAPEACRLVLLHDHRKDVRGTARWLRNRDVGMHHHVALDSTSDAERLYRFISGTAVGFVGCGGGALCAAHLGVYKALVERGVTFDAAGGTSSGAALGAAFVIGTDLGKINESLHRTFVETKALGKYTWPRYSLLDHTVFDSELRRLFGDIDIEDLWLPFYCVSTNLSRFCLEVHTTGPLWKAIRASGSIPVLLPPVYTASGEMLVDGCLLDNVPVDAMRKIKTGPNVVVSFKLPDLERFDVDYDALPSRAALVARTLNPMSRSSLPDAPGIIPVLMRSMMANRRDFQHFLSPRDLLLVPPIAADIGFQDWHRNAELMATAYAWTVAELDRRKAGSLFDCEVDT